MYASYMVSAIDANGYEGFASEPVVFAKAIKIIEIEGLCRKMRLFALIYFDFIHKEPGFISGTR